MRSTRLTQHIRAPRASVYRALLDPRAVAAWMVPDGMTSQVHAFEGREGGVFRISLTYDAPAARGKTTAHTDTYHGRFVRLVPDERVEQVLQFESDDASMQGEMRVTYTLSGAGDGTDLVAAHDDVPPGVSLEDNETGWRMSLRKLAALLEAPAPAESSGAPAYTAPLAAYEAEAEAVLAALHAGEDAVAWRFKWMHPRFRGKGVDDVRAATLGIDDARLLVAQEHAFDDWSALERFTAAVARPDSPVSRFERAVEAVVAGDVATLREMLRADRDLARARSPRRHHATLLHYVAANGVEGDRQRTPPNAVEVATILLDAGAEPDALADMYDHKSTTMGMLLTSEHPHEAGLQLPLAELLLDRGAAFDGPGQWGNAIMSSLLFGYADTARALAKRQPPHHHLAMAAGLGWADDVGRLLPRSTPEERHLALALAAMHGHAGVVGVLLDAGEDPDRYNPEGCHSHATPLHQAVWGNHGDVVRLLVERGARLDIHDRIFDGTPRRWAEYGKRTAMLPLLDLAQGA